MQSILFIFSLIFSFSSIQAHRWQPKIHAGTDAHQNQFPYVVSLRLAKKFDYGRIDYNHFAGGGLLSDRWIISSAHQLNKDHRNLSDIFIFVGAHHIWRDGNKYDVKKIITHPKQDYELKTNDIALLKTKISIVMVDAVQPLPISTAWIKPGEEGEFAGWGETENGLTPFHLKHITLRVIPNDVCINMHKKKYRLFIYDSILCTFAGYGAGTCNGDSGGVFVVNNKIVGILSWGDPCAIGKPDQFTRVSDYIDFIETHTKIKIV